MSLTARKFIAVKRLLAKVLLPSSNLVFLLTLLGIPFINRLKYNTSVEEHGYLNRYSLNELVQSDFNLMYRTKDELLIDEKVEYEFENQSRERHHDYYTSKNNYTDYEKKLGNKKPDSAYSYWSDEYFEDTPEIFVKLARTMKDYKNIQVSYNRYRYMFPTSGSRREVHGHNLLIKLNCMRCLARGATLMVATVNTDKYKEDITSVLLGITTMRHFSEAQYLSQNIFLLVTMRQLPFSVGTRQFLHDYNNSLYFKHRSGTIHNGLVIDLGSNQCMTFLISYEGIDGRLPNQDIVNIFVEISEMEGLSVNVRGMWQSIFRMGVNVDRNRHHLPLLEKNVNAFSLLCKASGKSEYSIKYNLELLLKSIVLTVRNQNNLDTVLERSFNFYYFIKPNSFVSISVYSLVVPLLFIRQITWLALYSFLDNMKMILGVLLVFANILLASVPTYVYLYNLVKEKSGSEVDSDLLDQVRVGLTMLVISYLVVFLLNFLLYRKFKDRFGDDYFEEHSLVREEIVAKIKKLKKTKKTTLLSKLVNKLVKFNKIFKRKKVKNGEDGEEGKETSRREMEDGSRKMEEYKDQLEKLMDLNESMGPYWYISRVPERLPRVDLFLLFSVYFLTISFMMGLSVLNWALCFIVTLPLLFPFNVVSLRSYSRKKNLMVVGYFLVLSLMMYPAKWPLEVVRKGMFEGMRSACGGLSSLFKLKGFKSNEFFQELGDKFEFLKEHVFGERVHWINSKADAFLLRKIYSASENHLLFGSYNIVVLLFTFGVMSHMLFLNVALLARRRPKSKKE